MRRKTVCVFLSLFCMMSLIIPSFAQAHELIYSYETLFMIRSVNGQRLKTCIHPQKISYYDVENGESGYVCAICSMKWRCKTEQGADAEILTNAALRSACKHSFPCWGLQSDALHVRACILCAYRETGIHDMVSADCTQYQYCTICDARAPDWPISSGHEMTYIFCMDEYLNSGSYVHEYRCMRQDPVLGYICDCVISVSSCDMGNLYWDAANNGKHMCYSACSACWAIGNVCYEDCPIAIYGDGHCVKCANPNPF